MNKELGTRSYAILSALLVVAGASSSPAIAQTSGGIPKSYFEALEDQRENSRTRFANSHVPQPAPAAATATVETERSAAEPALVTRTPSEEFLRASARGISAGTVEGLTAGLSAGGLGLVIVPLAVTAVAGLWRGTKSAGLQHQSAIDE
jgi:hypothetical protein